MAGQSIWYVRDSPLEGAKWQVSAYSGGSYEDGQLVTSPGLGESQFRLVWRTTAVPDGMLQVSVSTEELADPPALWFVHVDEPRARPRATNLVAFATDHFLPGTVITSTRFATVGVPNTEQVGAVRWYPEIAVVHQIFVSEGWRRLKAGSALIFAASALHQSMGWPGRLHSDGRRTDLGEKFVAAQRYSQRIAPLAETMPPLDPR